jgi:hypothetical protein
MISDACQRYKMNFIMEILISGCWAIGTREMASFSETLLHPSHHVFHFLNPSVSLIFIGLDLV